MPNTLQTELKLLRKKKNLTQEQVAAKMKMKRSSYAEKELTGDFEEYELKSLAKVLGTTVVNLKQFEIGSTEGRVKNYQEYVLQHIIRQEPMLRVILSGIAELLAKEKNQTKEELLKLMEEMVDRESAIALKLL